MYAYDLHIHSALSPCSDDDMTPNNIANMSKLKGLDIIAVTDHNSIGNLEAVIECANKVGLTVVPGMEIETREEIHSIVLFDSLEQAIKAEKVIKSRMMDIQNREDIFGAQILYDSNDNEIGKEKRLLISALDLGFNELYDYVKSWRGAMIPAHVNKSAYSVISNLGMIPVELEFKYLEVTRNLNLEDYLEKNPQFIKYSFLKSSDAHHLWDILEKTSYIDIEELSLECLIKSLG